MNQKLHSLTLLPFAALLLLGAILLPSCSDFFSGPSGSIVIMLTDRDNPATRAFYVPDTDDFILSVISSSGQSVYEGRFGSSPESISVAAGSYTVSAYSRVFSSPDYDCPQYGDTKVVVVQAGGNVVVELECRQLNSGMKLDVDESFKNIFPAGTLYFESSDGALKFSYGECRTAFFNPGSISVSLDDSGMKQILFSRELKAAQIMNMKLSSSVSASSGGVSIRVDTTATYLDDAFCYGNAGAQTPETAYSVTEARDHIGQSDAWVWGYICGVATGTGKISVDPPFEKDTNIIIGIRENSSDKQWCMSVELKSGPIRDALNLVGNQNLKGRKIAIRGSIAAAYFGIPGIKSVTEYQFL